MSVVRIYIACFVECPVGKISVCRQLLWVISKGICRLCSSTSAVAMPTHSYQSGLRIERNDASFWPHCLREGNRMRTNVCTCLNHNIADQ